MMANIETVTSVLQPQELRLSLEGNPKLRKRAKQTDTLVLALWGHKQSTQGTQLTYALSGFLTQQNYKIINGCCVKLLCLW